MLGFMLSLDYCGIYIQRLQSKIPSSGTLTFQKGKRLRDCCGVYVKYDVCHMFFCLGICCFDFFNLMFLLNYAKNLTFMLPSLIVSVSLLNTLVSITRWFVDDDVIFFCAPSPDHQ